MLTDWEQPVRTHHGDSLLNCIVTACLQACNSLRVFTCAVDAIKQPPSLDGRIMQSSAFFAVSVTGYTNLFKPCIVMYIHSNCYKSRYFQLDDNTFLLVQIK